MMTEQKKPETKKIHSEVPFELWAEIRKAAIDRNQTLSDFVKSLLEKFVEERKQ